jgi:hypothetical protein
MVRKDNSYCLQVRNIFWGWRIFVLAFFSEIVLVVSEV